MKSVKTRGKARGKWITVSLQSRIRLTKFYETVHILSRFYRLYILQLIMVKISYHNDELTSGVIADQRRPESPYFTRYLSCSTKTRAKFYKAPKVACRVITISNGVKGGLESGSHSAMSDLPFILRPARLDDVLPYAGFLADPEVSVWLDDSAQRPMSTGRVESILLREAWCLWIVEVNGVPAGVTSLYDPDLGRGTARLSIVVGNRQYWGRGLGTAAVRHVLEHAFVALNLRKVESEYLEPNHSARALHERTGFTIEGRARHDAWRRGRWVDRILLSILREEYQSKRENSSGDLGAGISG